MKLPIRQPSQENERKAGKAATGMKAMYERAESAGVLYIFESYQSLSDVAVHSTLSTAVNRELALSTEISLRVAMSTDKAEESRSIEMM